MKSTAIAALLAAATSVAAASFQQPPPTPIRWSAHDVTDAVKPGETVVVHVTAKIDEGWHLYALDAIPGGPIPTRLTATPDPPFTLDEKNIDKPEPKRAHDPNFGTETAYYEDSATFGLPLKIAASATGEPEVEITARFQACTDQICLRPQSQTIRVQVKIRR